jgi:DNA mismatch repair protein MutL
MTGEPSGSTPIRELDPATVDRIAAGEVVERPASAVKELVENSIDADAARVSVAVDSGGIDGIVVRDDGVGMSREGVRAAVREHTTSKIRDIDDLEGGVGTLGFRGEALHAIGAVSRLTVRTRERGSATGTELRVEGGEVTGVERVGCPEGTVVEVEDLFYNVPARRKYLKRPGTEFDHVNRIVAGYALANPGVAVSLEHGGRETFATTGRGDLRGTVLSVYGREVAESMVPVGSSVDGDDDGNGDSPAGDGPLECVSGLVSHPETNRASRDYLTTFVNGRYVTARAVREAVVEAYGRQLASDRYPFAVVRLGVDPATVDVNVHPRKLEVRFADEAAVREQVREAVRDGLLEAGLLRSTAPRGRSKAGETDVRPERADGTASDDRPIEDGPDGDGSSTSDPSGRVTGRSADDGGSTVGAATDDDPSEGRSGATGSRSGGSDVAASTANASTDSAPKGEPERPGAVPPKDEQSGRSSSHRTEAEAVDDDSDGRRERGRSDPHRRFRDSPAQSTLSATGESGDAGGALDVDLDRLPPMRVLGQVHDTYLVAETPDGVVLVDQHAADERVNYERLREAFAGDVTTQTLVEPVEVEVTPREAELFEHYGEALARLGFRASLEGDGDRDRVLVRTVPAVLAGPDSPELVRDLLADFVDGDPEGTVEAAVDDLLGDMACYPAVTGNESLAEGSVVALLSALDDCENPYACPHGRPVLVEVGLDEVEERFERDYPGHGGRRDS